MLGPERILGLDIGASTVKMGEFQGSKTHGLRLTNFAHADLGIDPETEEKRNALIAAALQTVLREKDFKTDKVVFGVSGQSVFTRFVKLPPVEESKVVQIIQYEAQQNVPFPIEEVIWDYQLVGSNPGGELEVVLLAIKSEIIQELNACVESAGLSTTTIDVAPMALYNAARYNYGEPDGCTVILDIGARTTNLLFLERNKLFSRSIPIAGNAITQGIASELNVSFAEAEHLKKTKGFVGLGGAYEEPEDPQQARSSKIIRNIMTRLHAEVTRSINFYRSQQGGSVPNRLLLSGGSSIIPYTDRFFQEKIQMPIEYFNAFRNVEIDDEISREELARCAHFYGEVVGLGLRKLTECPIEVNLVPPQIRAREQLQQKRPFFFGAAACVVLIPLCWLLYTQKTLSLKQRELDRVVEQLKRVQSLEKDVRREQSKLSDLQTKTDQIRGLVEVRTVWAELLWDLSQRLAPQTWITSVKPQPGSAAGATPPAGAGGFYTEIAFEAAGERVAGQEIRLVDTVVANLRESPFYDKEGVKVVQFPDLMSADPTFKFAVTAKLAKPIPF
jgi:type IV pilus assembly protein PilM